MGVGSSSNARRDGQRTTTSSTSTSYSYSRNSSIPSTQNNLFHRSSMGAASSIRHVGASNLETTTPSSSRTGQSSRSVRPRTTLSASPTHRHQIVRCVRCRLALQPPAGHERFRCPCGQLMRNPFMIERVRCPQCRGVLAPPPGLQRFRCPCGAVLALPGGPLWNCGICSHKNPTHRRTCEMCGTDKEATDGSTKESEKGGSEYEYAIRRAKMLEEGKQSWTKRMDADNKIRWMRKYNMNSNDLDVELLTEAELKERTATKIIKSQLVLMKVDVSKALTKSDLVDLLWDLYESIPTMSASSLKKLLKIVGVDDSECVEKTDLVALVRQSVHCNVRGKFDGYIRSFDRRGDLSWVPANIWSMEAIVRSRGGKVIASVGELRNASTLPFSRKLAWFRHKVGLLRIPWSSGHQKIRVSRDRLLADAYDNFRMLRPSEDFWRIFRFEFIGEPAIDAGGVAREWFSEVGRAIFNVDFGLFSYGESDNLCYKINPHSGLANENHLEYFRFVGRLIGKALFDQQIVSAHLTLPIYKHILGWPIVLHDLEFVNQMMSRSVRQIIQVDDVEDLMLDFTTTEDCFGKVEMVPLKKNGDEIDVTNENRSEYVQLILRHHMFECVKSQLSQLLQGFYEVIPPALISIFDFQELELIINGLPQIDVGDWEDSTVYGGAYHKDHKVIRWFWEIVGQMNQETRARLLQFSTGTSRVPVQGFKAMQSKDGKLNPFTIKAVPISKKSDAPFPVAHTCFNRIDLPVYKGRDIMKQRLMTAIQMEATGFGLE